MVLMLNLVTLTLNLNLSDTRTTKTIMFALRKVLALFVRSHMNSRSVL